MQHPRKKKKPKKASKVRTRTSTTGARNEKRRSVPRQRSETWKSSPTDVVYKQRKELIKKYRITIQRWLIRVVGFRFSRAREFSSHFLSQKNGEKNQRPYLEKWDETVTLLCGCWLTVCLWKWQTESVIYKYCVA